MKTLFLASAVMAAILWAGTPAGAPANAAARPRANAPAPLAHGQKVYEYWCKTCHGDGIEYPGTGALAAKYKGEVPAELHKRTDLEPDTVKYFVRHGVSIMPFFRRTEISDADLDALAAYLSRKKR